MSDPLYPYINSNGKAYNGNGAAFAPMLIIGGLGVLSGILWVIQWAVSAIV